MPARERVSAFQRPGGTEVARRIAAACAALLLAAPTAWAQTVSLGGTFGDKALLVIDGSPRTLAVGTKVNDVRLVSVRGAPSITSSALSPKLPPSETVCACAGSPAHSSAATP